MNVWKNMTLTLGGLLLLYAVAVSWSQVFDVEAEQQLTYKHVDGKSSSANLLLEVPIYGTILTDSSEPASFGLQDVTYGYQIQRLLNQVGEEPRVKGILLRLNTGGGTIVGSEAIYRALVKYRKTTKKPVMAYIEETSASGGVMAMMGADVIYAAPGSDIGSIGVVGLNHLVYDNPTSITDGNTGESITAESGINQIVITAGKGKDLSHSSREPTAEELKVMRQGVNNEYNNFVKLVARTRGIPEKTLRNEMGVYIFDNKLAEKYKLIDGTKSRPEAIAILANRAKIGEDFRLVQVKQPENVWQKLGISDSAISAQKQQSLQRDRCALTRSRVLAYYGNPRELCPSK